MLVDVRLADEWVHRNQHLSTGSITTPLAARMTDAELDDWLERALDSGAGYELLRDATLFDFSSDADVLLFMLLVQSGLRLQVNVCLNAQEYINENVPD